MKSYIYPLAASLLFSVASCSHEEDNIWKDSAAERTERVVKEQREVLCGAEFGWNMYYFAPESDNGGVNFTLKFNENSSVVIGSKNIYNTTSYAEETSMWEIITDNGPVLTFNSYNQIFHYFSDPDANGIVGTGSQGVGLGGDYEFMIMSYSPDSVILKGKKTGVYCKMFPLQADEIGEAYFQKLDEFESSMFNSIFPYIWLEVENGERYTAKFATSSRTIDFVIEGGDPLFDTHTVPYVVTNKGIRLFEPFEGDNESFSVQNFVYNVDNTTLTCTDDGKSEFTAGNLAEFFATKKQKWAIDADKVGGTFQEAYTNIIDRCKIIRYNLNNLYIGYLSESDVFAFGFTLKSGKNTYNGNFYGDLNPESGMLNAKFENEGDDNARILSGVVPQFFDMIKAINDAAPFYVESESSLNPTHITLVSKNNSENRISFTRIKL